MSKFENLKTDQSVLAPPLSRDLAGSSKNFHVSRLIRFLDISFSVLALFVLAPVLSLISLGIKLDSKGPVLFRQRRHGKDKVIFEILKFRTMSAKASQDDFKQARWNDFRVTRFGAFLRRTSLDELPQLINVLQGDMSLVGPRPHPVELDEEFGPIISDYDQRFLVRPGLTGLAQVRGYRGPTETTLQMEKRISADIEFLSRVSTRLYIRILLKTATLVLFTSKIRGF